MATVTSKDGTTIAYDRQGTGPAIIMVGGGLVDPITGRAGRAENEPLAAELANSFTVLNYDRRGRADSGDTLPYAVEREIEDIAALIAEAGRTAHLYGLSSGGALALEATAAGPPIGKIAVYEVPYLPEGMQPYWLQYVEQLNAVLAEDRRGDAVELFMRLAGSSGEIAEGAKSSPTWAACEAIAHTLAYDAACLGDGLPPADRLAKVSQPTLVATGAVSAAAQEGTGGMPPDFFAQAGDAIAALLPNAERRVIERQGHVVDPKTFAPVLEEFFAG